MVRSEANYAARTCSINRSLREHDSCTLLHEVIENEN